MLEIIIGWLGWAAIEDVMVYAPDHMMFIIEIALTACALLAIVCVLYVIDMLCGAFKQLWKRG